MTQRSVTGSICIQPLVLGLFSGGGGENFASYLAIWRKAARISGIPYLPLQPKHRSSSNSVNPGIAAGVLGDGRKLLPLHPQVGPEQGANTQRNKLGGCPSRALERDAQKALSGRNDSEEKNAQNGVGKKHP